MVFCVFREIEHLKSWLYVVYILYSFYLAVFQKFVYCLTPPPPSPGFPTIKVFPSEQKAVKGGFTKVFLGIQMGFTMTSSIIEMIEELLLRELKA